MSLCHRLSTPPNPSLASCLLAALLLSACEAPPEAAAIHLVDRFAEARVEASPPVAPEAARLAWEFTGEESEGEEAPPAWRALHGVDGLRVADGRLRGRAGEPALLAVALPEGLDAQDSFHSLEVRIRVSAGERLGLALVPEEELDVDEIVGEVRDDPFLDFNVELEPGDGIETYTVDASDARFRTSFPLGAIRHLVLRPTDAVGAELEIDSVRLTTLKEHLAGIPSGIGWHGLSEVFRETLVSRTRERVTFTLDLPSEPFLDLAIGTVEQGPVTFRVEAASGGERRELLRRTVTTPGRWLEVPLELAEMAGARAELTFALDGAETGALGFWGSPVVRNRAGRPAMVEPSPARRALDAPPDPPRGVILVIADTLRRDHFQPYGYERVNAPVMTDLARRGVLFRDAISQGSWTKVSVSSIVTSLYPSTHGIRDMPDRMPASVTTLAEAYRAAGYATFATSSVPFTGRLTNLHQGVEVLHESSSIPEPGHSFSKTSRTYVDRLTDWLETRREVPFFAFLHVFDPHSPFEPYHPYQTLFLGPEELAEHRRQMETVKEFIEEEFMRRQALPTREEIERSGLDIPTYVAREKAWYDASIKAMDVEMDRLLERLRTLDLLDDVLIAFVSDHGEEFLEHGRHFHGYHAYGEMVNVPLILHWERGLPGGVEVEPTVQSIDLMPTLLELSRLPVPERAQGQSLLPLVAGGRPSELGWRSRPAFTERAPAPVANPEEDDPLEQIAVVDGEWKLVRNLRRPGDRPEHELYDHRTDPLNLVDVAADHPEVVARLAAVLDNWHRAALAAKLEAEEAATGMSEEELSRLRALGYVN